MRTKSPQKSGSLHHRLFSTTRRFILFILLASMLAGVVPAHHNAQLRGQLPFGPGEATPLPTLTTNFLAKRMSGIAHHARSRAAAQSTETLLSDDFDDDLLDPARWRLGVMSKISVNPGVTVAEQNQRLEIFPLIDAVGFNGYVTSATYDFTAKQATVEVIQALSSAQGEVLFSVGTDVKNNYKFSLSDGVLYFVANERGAETYDLVKYDGEQHRHLRLRHDQLSDEIVWETSADRYMWTEGYRKARGIMLTAAMVELVAGTFLPARVWPGIAIFDNFQLETVTAAPPTPTPTPIPTPTPTPTPQPTPTPTPTPSPTPTPIPTPTPTPTPQPTPVPTPTPIPTPVPTPTPTPTPQPTPTPTPLPTPPPSSGAQFYVAPNGQPSGNGSISQPWDLATALAQPAIVRPGATLWLRGGTYSGAFTSQLTGTAAAPIIVRQFPGERAILDISYAGTAALTVNGAYTWFWGFEVKSSSPTRVYSTVSSHAGTRRSNGVNVYGRQTKLINLTVHDAQDGIGFWVGAEDAEIYGCLVYNNGLIEPNRGHGHGIYIQNRQGTKQIQDVISFNNYATGMKAFGESGYAIGINFDGVISFNNGSPGSFAGNPAGYELSHRWTNLFIGAAVNPADRISITNSYLYHQPGTTIELANLGLGYSSGNNLDVVVRDNYVAGGNLAFTMNDWRTAVVTGNTFYSGEVLAAAVGVPAVSNYLWNNNVFFTTAPPQIGFVHSFLFNQATNRFGGGRLTHDDPGTALGRGWKQWTGWDANSLYTTGRPSVSRVFVRPNRYELGRANIAVFNWAGAASVTVNLSNSGLSAGQQFEIRDAQNYFGAPVASGTYNPANPTVNIPMSGLVAVAPIGSPLTPSHTAPEFGAFVVLPTSAAAAPPPAPFTDATPPTVALTAPTSNQTVSGTVTVRATATDNVGISKVEFYIDGTLLGTDTTNPYSLSWDARTVSNGPHTVAAKAFDAANNQRTASVNVNVNNPTTPPPDTTPPTVSITAPANGATVSSTVSVSANASDNVRVAGVQFKLDGANLGAEDTSAPYSVSWNAATATNGRHTLTAIARDAVGNQAASPAISITVNNVASPPPPPSGSTVNLNSSIRHQTMSGWEVVPQMGQDSPAFSNFRNGLLDQAANDLGINRVRLEVWAGMENSRDWWSEYRAGRITYEQWRQVRYQIENDNADPFSINPNGFKFAHIDHYVDTMVLPLKQRLAARGETLYLNLCYVNFGPSSGFQQWASPEEYAELVLAAYLHLRNKYGLVPDALEVVLEPDNNTGWTGTRMGQAIVAAANRFRANGFTPAFIVPSTTNAANAPIYFDQIIQVPGALQYITEVSYHRYCCATPEVLRRISDRAAQYGKKAAMSEFISADYQMLHEDIKSGRSSSWQQFALAYQTNDNGAQYYTINDSNPSNPIITMGSRTKFLRQYFKYIRMNAVRIEATSGNSSLDPLAFINPNGKYVVVGRAAAGLSFNVQGLPAGTYGIKYTTASQYDVNLADVTIGAGQTMSANIPAAGVITIYAK